MCFIATQDGGRKKTQQIDRRDNTLITLFDDNCRGEPLFKISADLTIVDSAHGKGCPICLKRFWLVSSSSE